MTDVTDVNTAFAQERTALISSLENQAADALARASQYNRAIDAKIEAGTLVPIGVDQYRVEDPGSEKGYKIVGDVAFDEVAPKCKAITPVPGGVGPMTIAMLMATTVKACKQLTLGA